MKTTLVQCMTMVAMVFWVSSATANSIDVDLGEPSGVQLTIYDNDQSSGGPDQVLFSFTNYAGPGSLDAIYIDSNGRLDSIYGIYQSDGVDFTTDEGGPANLPGGGPLGFSPDFVVRAVNGLDQAGEFLGIVFNLNPCVTLAYIANDVVVLPEYGPDAGNPETPWGSPVPEPASLILFGIGTAGLAGLRRRQRRNK